MLQVADPAFFKSVFLSLREREVPFDLQNEAENSFLCDFSGFQDGFRYRIRRRSLFLADRLIDDKGNLNLDELLLWISRLEKAPYIPYPEGYSDALFSRYQLSFLQRLAKDPNLWRLIKRCERPLCHKIAEDHIRDTLGYYSPSPLSDGHIRKAVLASCLHFLRQNVGSCFATAPAILIQQHQIEKMLEDIYLLLATGTLKRVVGGVEQSVPLSPSWGLGDLKKPLALGRCDRSLGLLRAFIAAGLIAENLNREEQFEKLKQLISPAIEDPTLTLAELIQKVLLHHLNLSLEEYEGFSQRPGPLSPFLSQKKRDLCDQMQLKERRARSAFKAVTENALLKAWEFTLASLSEVKMEFSKWNLYISLGFDAKEPDGIGAVIYRFVDEKLQQCNAKVEKFQREYELAYFQLSSIEARLKAASSEDVARRLRAEYQSNYLHMQTCSRLRDESHSAAVFYSSLFSFLIQQYDQKFPEYFQEVYDAEMQEIKGGLYDDAPAGFRLVYKHGRRDPSTWTFVYSEEQYIDVLVDFFHVSEPFIEGLCELDEGRAAISDLVSKIIVHLRTEEFIKGAMARTMRAHGVLLSVRKMEKKPWVYTSGGSMANLLKSYYRREQDITEESRWAESTIDLLIFIIDALKNIPLAISQKYLEKEDRGLLAYSPTHAFIIYPGWKLLKEAWQDDLFTYTWVRDQILRPRQIFYRDITLSPSEQLYLLDAFCDGLPPIVAHRTRSLSGLIRENSGVLLFREMIAREISAPGLIDELDKFLYRMVPLVPGSEWKEWVNRLLGELADPDLQKTLDSLSDNPAEWFGSKPLQEITKGCFLLAKQTHSFDFDLHERVAANAEILGLSPPHPLIFADSNWANGYFAFLVNPGTEELELWLTDITGSTGMPMSMWKDFMNGTRKLPWGLYTRPYEYDSF